MDSVPQSRYYESHRLRLHYVDWGNAAAPPLILVHGGRDHCRNCDAMAARCAAFSRRGARSARPRRFRLAKGGSYALTEYVYDLAQLVRSGGAPQSVVGHSMGGMVSLIFSGSFPELVSKLVVLDGVT